MDKTNAFVDCLKAIKGQNKAINEMLLNETNGLKNKSVLNKNKTINDFNRNAKDLVKSIGDMKTYLIDNRKDYINIYSPLLSLASMMTDRERDEIDEDVEQFIKICNEKAIKCLRYEVKRMTSKQLCEHQNSVIDLIEKYLKNVCDIHCQQKAIRIKRAVEKQRLLRLGNIVTNRQTESQIKHSLDLKPKPCLDSDKENQRLVPKSLSETNGESYENQLQYNSDTNRHKIADNVNSDHTYQQLELSKHEIQVFEEENNQLFNEMNSMSDEVKDIELKVIEIARLQEIFTENVLKQEIDLNKLNDTTIASTENIRGGNEQLREAMKKNAGFRVWILFFITTLAFTILFLDWYND